MARRQQPPAGTPAALIGAAATGAALMYFLDPDRGRSRRQRMMEQVNYASRALIGTADNWVVTARSGPVRGTTADTHPLIEGADDQMIAERIREDIVDVVSYPSRVVVHVEDGRVLLSGPVMEDEMENLLRCVHAVPGVVDVDNMLAPVSVDEDWPEAQTTSEEVNWSPRTRLLSAIAAGGLAVYGARRRDPVGVMLAVLGAAVAARGATNRSIRRMVGARGAGERGIEIQKTITINAAVHEVFTWFTNWERWPKWMSHIKEVRATGSDADGTGIGERTHWVVDGPAGTTVEWDAITTRLHPNRLIAWRSVEGADVHHAGTIRFEAVDEATTRVRIHMSYSPPAGRVGHVAAKLFGRDARQQMEEDVERLREVIET